MNSKSAQIRELAKKGLSSAQIQKELGVTHQMVSYATRKRRDRIRHRAPDLPDRTREEVLADLEELLYMTRYPVLAVVKDDLRTALKRVRYYIVSDTGLVNISKLLATAHPLRRTCNELGILTESPATYVSEVTQRFVQVQVL